MNLTAVLAQALRALESDDCEQSEILLKAYKKRRDSGAPEPPGGDFNYQDLANRLFVAKGKKGL